MAIEDLDLEFEDEEEQSKGDALDVDVDLSFSAYPVDGKLEGSNKRGPMPKKRPHPAPKAGTPEQPQNTETPSRPTPRPQNNNTNNVRNISEAPRPQPQPQPRPKAAAIPQARPSSQVTPDYANDSSEDIAYLKEEIAQLKAQMQNIQHQADIKLAVAEAEKEYLVEYVSNAKVLDHQVTQVLSRINKKVPALGAEVQLLKKYVSEFVKNSQTKKKKGD
ncbi:MAG: hypothetical protein CME62_04135 [Halobacteriovoraceae bacterium]|nr:hypothetical protein [Halobacteriovoraceae bacterium]|tara:strand:- start:6589 stop:7245 length:657 start_codon:yes stop_codon:yes gene_type:complete